MKRAACELHAANLRNFGCSVYGEEGALSEIAVLHCRLTTTQRGVLLVSAVSGRYLSSQLAFSLNAKPTWAKGGAWALHALSPPSP